MVRVRTSLVFALPGLLGLLCVPAPAHAGDLTVEVFDHQLGAGLRPTSVVSFPGWDRDYSEVILTLEGFNPCEVGVDGDEWDRTAYIYVQDEDDELIQIARWLTPYWNLPFTWTVDITEMQSVLHGDRKIFVDVGDRHMYSLTIELSYGAPARLPVRTTNLWRGSPGVAAIADFFAPLEVPVHAQADYVDVRLNISSHGGNGPIEFGPAQWGQIGVNGEVSPDWYHYMSRGDDDLSDGFNCPDNPTGPQGTCAASQPACAVDDEQAGGGCVTGNWSGPRINWCPGELILPWIVDISAAVEPGALAWVDYGHADVSNAGAGSLRVDTQWIESRATDTMIVAPLWDWAPRRFAADELAGTGRSYWIKNHEAEAIDWTASASADWLTLTPSAGSLAAGEAVELSVRFNDATDALGLGDHGAELTVTDTTHALSETRAIDLALEAKGVLAYWPLDGDDDQILDRSGNEHHGALLDDAAPTRGEGRFAGGLPLSPGLERVEVASELVHRHQHGSYALWFRTSAVATQMLVTAGPEDALGAMRLFIAGDGTELKFHANSHTATWSELSLADGAWHHVVATLDGDADTLGLYLDGVALDSQTLAWAGRLDMDGGRLAMGAQLAPDTVVVETTTLDGSLDDVRVYNYELSPEQVAQVYAGGPAMMPAPFDDARNVEPEATLSWIPGASALSHNLYIGLDSDAVRDADESSELFVANLAEASFEPEVLERAQYFWRVDELTQDGVIPGPVWRFDTFELAGDTGGTTGETGPGQAEAGAGGCGCVTGAASAGDLGRSLGPWLLLLPLVARRRRRDR